MQTNPILVVEDDKQVSDVVLFILEKHGFRTVLASDGRMGLEMFRSAQPCLVVLDLNLPHMGGLDLFKAMRQEDPLLPVIMLTCQSGDIDRVLGLELGADDYITKPFLSQELVARIRAVLRRCQGQAGPRHILAEGPFWLDHQSYIFRYYGKEIALTRQEFAIMQALVASPARIFTREVLIGRMYDDAHPVTERSVDACIKRIRQKLSNDQDGFNPIRTVYGIGYKLNEKLLI
jgi:DNA-binding response OmpR family regulator